MARRALAAWLCCLVGSSAAVNANVAKVQHGRERLQQLSSETSFVRTLAFKHTLRVCNAYPYSAPIEIFHGKKRITDPPLPYKSCREFSPPIRDGDKLQFKIGGSNAGSFAISELPNNDAVLVLIVYRHNAISSAVAFESHIFANLINAQIAVLDTYKGRAEAQPRIQDASSAKTSRSEELRYDSVVAVNPGIYEVVLQSEEHEMKARSELVALNRESYVVVRCGVEAQEGQSYPQELIVFPHSDPKMLTGSAATRRAEHSALLAVIVATGAVASQWLLA